MDALKIYEIHFASLKVGSHYFDFEVDGEFFEAFIDKEDDDSNISEIMDGDLDVDVELQRGTNALTLIFDIDGEVAVPCDRCLDECWVPIEFNGELSVKFTKSEIEESERYDGEVLWLNVGENVLNVAQYIYESIILSLPYQRVHGEDENGESLCDEDMLRRFKIVSSGEFDEMTEEATQKSQKLGDNPEWDKLQELRDKMADEDEDEGEDDGEKKSDKKRD